MEDFDLARGLTALREIQKDLIAPKDRSEVIKIVRPYIEGIYPIIDKQDWDVLKQELSHISIERAEQFKKKFKPDTLLYSDIEYASAVIKHTFLLAQFSKDGDVLEELEKLIKSFVASADSLLPSEEEIRKTLDSDLQKLGAKEMDKAADAIVEIQKLFVYDKNFKKEFNSGLSQPQFNFALEVLLIGMIDFYCQNNQHLNGYVKSLAIIALADKRNGANIWDYSFEQAFDRFNLIVKFAQEYKEIAATMRLGAKILSEKFSSDFKFAPLGLSFYLELPENEEIFNFFKTLKFNK